MPSALGSRLYGLYVVAIAVSLLGNLVVRMSMRGEWFPRWLEVTLAVLAAVPLMLAALRFRSALGRDLDEMLQKVVLEGFSFALIVWLPLAALYVNLRSAGVDVPNLDPPDVLMLPAILVGLGVLVAARRYR